MNAIEVRNLTKIFPVPFSKERLVAVRDITLTVEPGQIYGLLGPNGSGKSTTMKVILGLVTPTKGTTSIFGVDSSEVRSREAVGFLPENPYFYKFLTGEETITYFGKLCGLRGAKLKSRVNEMLELVRLSDARKRRVGGYSKGMLQRLGLAQAMVQEPKLLVLDEPTAGVDPAGSREIRDLIFKFKEQGLSVLFCSHLLGQVQEVCDRIGIMHRGSLVREGPLDELISIHNRRELILEDASPDLIASIERDVAASGAKLISSREPQTTLEDFYLEVVSAKPEDK